MYYIQISPYPSLYLPPYLLTKIRAECELKRRTCPTSKDFRGEFQSSSENFDLKSQNASGSFHRYKNHIEVAMCWGILLLVATLSLGVALPAEIDAGLLRGLNNQSSSPITFKKAFGTVPKVGVVNLMGFTFKAFSLNTLVSANVTASNVTAWGFSLTSNYLGFRSGLNAQIAYIATTGDPCQISTLKVPMTSSISSRVSFSSSIGPLKFHPATNLISVSPLLSSYAINPPPKSLLSSFLDPLSVVSQRTITLGVDLADQNCSTLNYQGLCVYSLPLTGPLTSSGVLDYSVNPNGCWLNWLTLLVVVHTVERNGAFTGLGAFSSQKVSVSIGVGSYAAKTPIRSPSVFLYGEKSFSVPYETVYCDYSYGQSGLQITYQAIGACFKQSWAEYRAFSYLSCSTNQTIVGEACVCRNSTGLASCQSCRSECETCNAADCTSCKDGLNRTDVPVGGQCPCLPGYVPVSGVLRCQCRLPLQLYGSECKCRDKTYLIDGLTQSCLPCPLGCFKCTGPATCLECVVDSNRQLQSGECVPKLSFYETGIEKAAACDSSCLTCSGPSTSNCLTCDFFLKSRVLNGTACVCARGYFLDGIQLLCRLCSSSCLTCSGPTTSSCLSCSASWNRMLINGSCQCTSGSFENGNSICPKCDPSCLTCSGGGRNSCLSCDGGQRRRLQGTTCVCADRTFLSGVDCQPCHISCAACSGPASTQCTACNSSQFRQLQGGSCVCVANSTEVGSAACNPCSSLSMYWAARIAMCVPCNMMCKTCDSDQIHCTSCRAEDFRELVNGMCLCRDGYNTSNDGTTACTNDCNKVARFCHYSCLVCDGSEYGNCLSCDSSKNREFLQNPGPVQEGKSPKGSCPCRVGLYESWNETNPVDLCCPNNKYDPLARKCLA